MILGVTFLDLNCLFPKPIMAQNVFAIGEYIFGIDYLRICVDASSETQRQSVGSREKARRKDGVDVNP